MIKYITRTHTFVCHAVSIFLYNLKGQSNDRLTDCPQPMIFYKASTNLNKTTTVGKQYVSLIKLNTRARVTIAADPNSVLLKELGKNETVKQKKLFSKAQRIM